MITAALATVVVLLGAAAAGWWSLERSADGPVTDQHRSRGRVDADHVRAEELDDSRAELALRTCSPAPPGDRVRVEGLLLLGRSVHRWRLARQWLAAHGTAPGVAGSR